MLSAENSTLDWLSHFREHRRKSQPILLGRKGFRDNQTKELIFCTGTGLRVEAWRVNFYSLEKMGGGGGEMRVFRVKLNFSGLDGLRRTF